MWDKIHDGDHNFDCGKHVSLTELQGLKSALTFLCGECMFSLCELMIIFQTLKKSTHRSIIKDSYL